MIRFLIIGILLAAFAFIVLQILKFSIATSSGRSQRQKDIKDLKARIRTYISDLIPMTDREMEDLSTNHDGISVRKGLGIIKTGVFTTIYHEPILAYALKSYTNLSDSRILLVSTDSDDIIYETIGETTKVFLNDEEMGTIDAKGDFYNTSNNLLGHISADPALSSHPVLIDGKELGEIINPELNESPNPRAYQFLEPMEDEHKKIFKVLTFLSLMEETIDN